MSLTVKKPDPVDRVLGSIPRIFLVLLLLLGAIASWLHFSAVRPLAEQVPHSPEVAFVSDIAAIVCKEVDDIEALVPRVEAAAEFKDRLESKSKSCTRSLKAAAKCLARMDAVSIVQATKSLYKHKQTGDDLHALLARVDRAVAKLRPPDPLTQRISKALRGVTKELADADWFDLLFAGKALEARLEKRATVLAETIPPWIDQLSRKYPEIAYFEGAPSLVRLIMLLDLVYSDEVQREVDKLSRKARTDCAEAFGLANRGAQAT